MSERVKATVTVSPDTVTAFRQRMGNDYPGIPDIAQAPLALLIRFAVLITAGIPVDEAKRALKPLSRGRTWRDNATV
jgi:hypothetical protein